MNNLEKLGFDNWFWESVTLGKDKVDLSKTDFNIVRVISVKETTLYFENSLIIKPQCINEKI